MVPTPPRYFRLILMICFACLASRIEAANVSPQTPAVAQEKQSQEEFSAQVRQKFERKEFAALDAVASQARVSKERMPGGDWKLYVFYQALAWPVSGVESTDQQWKDHLKLMQEWRDYLPDSMTARIAQAGAWVEYAKKARNSEHTWSEIDKRAIGGKQYQERLSQAKKALDFDMKNFAV